MFVGGTSLYEKTTTFWLKVAFITFNQAVFKFFPPSTPLKLHVDVCFISFLRVLPDLEIWRFMHRARTSILEIPMVFFWHW